MRPQFREFYVSLATYVATNLPYGSTFLRCLQFVALEQPIDERRTSRVAALLPTVVPSAELDELKTEIRLFNVTKLPEEVRQLAVSRKLSEAWQALRQTMGDTLTRPRFPRLCNLSAAVCTLFHGNADPERYIGKSHDIDSNPKRNALSRKYIPSY